MKKLAKDKNPDARAAAARDLGSMGAWDAVPALKETLRDRDRTARFKAAVALSNMKAASPAELAVPVASLLDGADRDDREQVVRMLLNLGLADPTVRRTVLDTLANRLPEIRSQLLYQMWSDHTLDASTPWRAEVVTPITQMITADDDATVRTRAITLLRHVRPVPASLGEALMKAIDDPNHEVAAAAAGSINGMQGSPFPMKAVTHLMQRLKTGDPDDRVAAAHTLGSLIGWREHFTPTLASAMLTDKAATVRVAAVAALVDVDDDTAIPSLLKALKTDADPGVKVAVCTIWAKTNAKLRLARTKQLEAARTSDPNPKVRAAAQAAADALRR